MKTNKLPFSNRLAGVCLAATTSHDSDSLGSSRTTCLESLLSLLGSVANRKEEEIALRVGEALGQYAGCYDVKVELHDWREGYDETFAHQLAPHEHALYVLLRKQYRLSNPLHRTACAPALLGIVALVARGVRSFCAALASSSDILCIPSYLSICAADEH